MAQRFYGEFADDQATEWRINIYDDEYSLATSSITLGAEGFVLSYEGAQDDMFQRIIPSKLTFSAHIRSSTAFETWVNEQMPRRGEAQIKVAVYEDPDGANTLYWAGILLIDQVQLPDDYDALIDFTASDGLALLQRDDYSSLATNLNTKLATWLARSPVAEFWSAGDGFLRYVNDYYALGYTGSDYFDDAIVQEPLNHSDTNFAGEPQEFTTYQKIEALMSAFNMRLFQSEGYWWAIPLSYYERIANSGVPSSLFRQVDKTGATVALTFLESQYLNNNKIYEDGVDATRMAGGNTLHLTGKKQVRITRISQDADFLYRSQSGQVPYQVLSAHGSTTNGLLYAEGTPFLIEGWASFFRYPDSDIAGDAALVTLRATFSLQVGTKYYNGTSWQDTSATWTYDIEEFLRDSGTVSFLAPVIVETAPVPAEGDGLTFTATYRFINGVGTDVSSDMTNGLFGWQVILRLGNESSITNFTYAAETTEENFDEIDLADTLFGSFSPESWSNYINGTIKYDGDYPEYYQGYTWAGSPSAGSSLLTLVTNDALRMTQLPVKVKQNGYLHEVPKMWQAVKQGSEYWVPLTISTVMNSRQSSLNRFLIDYDASNISDDSGPTGGGTSIGLSGFTEFDGVTSVNGETPDIGGGVVLDGDDIAYDASFTVNDLIDANTSNIDNLKTYVVATTDKVELKEDANNKVTVDGTTSAENIALTVDGTDVFKVSGSEAIATVDIEAPTLEANTFAGGLILKDSTGTRWRVQVQTDGTLRTTSL